MTKIENDINESYSPNLLFLNENRFEDDQVDFWPLKLTLKTENARFLLACALLLLFTRYQNFLWVCQFLCKNIASFGYPS